MSASPRATADDLPAGDYVRISVTDTGSGIAARGSRPRVRALLHHQGRRQGHRPRPQPDFRLRPPGGAAPLPSTVGDGTTVSIFLPRFLGAEEAAGQCGPRRRPAETTAGRHAGAAILVVEDDPRVSRSTVDALEELGYRPTACDSGGEALEQLAARAEIDLVVTDVMMPEMTGTELAAEVRAAYPRMPSCSSPAMSARRRRRRADRRRAAAQAVHRRRPRQRGRERARRRPSSTDRPRFNRRGSRISAPTSGQRRCQGLTSIRVPAWRLIFQAR